MLRLKCVSKNSVADELGLKPGTFFHSVNGRPLEDSLDWEFLTADDRFVLCATLPDGQEVEYDIERSEGMILGVEFDAPQVKRCVNRCKFCFVKGNPRGLRKTLYVKDDDYRLSFLHGNFVTLTNLTEADLARIVEYRLSPLYVSVHATETTLRRQILGNPKAPDVVEQIKKMADGGIGCHTQIVLQPEINDGIHLENTLEDLFALGDAVLSVSVVPVGRTKVDSAQAVRQLTTEECRHAVHCVEPIAKRAKTDRSYHWAYGSDELYLAADFELPGADRYDEFEQLENGVGSIRHLELRVDEFHEDLGSLRIATATGQAMAPFMENILSKLHKSTGADFDLLVLENTLFGPSVTTAGLLPGEAFSKALKNRTECDVAMIPAEAVNDQNQFLDDMTVEELRDELPMDVRLSYCFADSLEGYRR